MALQEDTRPTLVADTPSTSPTPAALDADAGAQTRRQPRTRQPRQDRPGRRPLRHQPRRHAARGRRRHAGRHPHDLGPARRRQHPGTRRAVDPHRGRAHLRGAQLLPPRRPPPRHGHRQGGPTVRRVLLQPVGRPRPRAGHHRRRDGARWSPRTAASSTTRSSPSATGSTSSSASAPSTTGTCCATPRPARSSRRRSTSSCGSPAACRPTPTTPSSSTGSSVRLEYLPSLADAVQLGHHPPADVELLPARLADRQTSTPSTTATDDVARLSKHAGGIGLSYSRIRSRGFAHPRHQRPVQRHRAVAQDARLVGRRGQPGRSPQGRRLRVPRERGTPTSRSSSSSATTPATSPAAPTT